MDEYIESLKQRVNIVKKAVASAEKDALHFPEGRMRVSQSGKQVRYYHVIPPAERSISPAAPKDYSGTYIRAENIELAKRLAQKDYNESFLKTARDEIRILEFSIRSLLQKNTDMVYRQERHKRERGRRRQLLADSDNIRRTRYRHRIVHLLHRLPQAREAMVDIRPDNACARGTAVHLARISA